VISKNSQENLAVRGAKIAETPAALVFLTSCADTAGKMRERLKAGIRAECEGNSKRHIA
jgi:hypothetical protein